MLRFVDFFLQRLGAIIVSAGTVYLQFVECYTQLQVLRLYILNKTLRFLSHYTQCTKQQNRKTLSSRRAAIKIKSKLDSSCMS